MLGFRDSNSWASRIDSRRALAVLPILLSTASLAGLRGVGSFHLSAPVSLTVGVVALAGAVVLRGRRADDEAWILSEVGLAVAVTACGAALLAVLATGRL
jgi:hypothetical protein